MVGYAPKPKRAHGQMEEQFLGVDKSKNVPHLTDKAMREALRPPLEGPPEVGGYVHRDVPGPRAYIQGTPPTVYPHWGTPKLRPPIPYSQPPAVGGLLPDALRQMGVPQDAQDAVYQQLMRPLK